MDEKIDYSLYEIELLKKDFQDLKEDYKDLSMNYKKQKRELMLLKKQLERNRIATEAKDNMNKVISQKRSELERYMNLLMENFPDIVLLFNNEKRIVYCTDSFLRCCNIPAFGLVKDMCYHDLLLPYISKEFMDSLDTAFSYIYHKKTTLELTEVIDFCQNGNLRNYSIQIAPMLNDNGTVEGSMVFFYDTTEIIAAQKEAERANAAKSDFLATVSHEIRTPMNAIIGVSKMLMSTELDNNQKTYLTNIQNSSSVLLNLIDDILDFSKIEAGKLEIISEPFVLRNMLNHIQSMFKWMFEQKGLKFNCEFSEELPNIVYGDESRISQILTNILNNALKYTEEGKVAFKVYKEDYNNICFLIADTGIGIKKEALPQLFNAFERLDIIRNRKVKGTGLGLAITRRLCEIMSGTIEVESDYGIGSCFTIKLPLEIDDTLESQESTDEIVMDFLVTDAEVLIVDDIQINLDIAEYMVSQYNIYPDLALSGEEAIRRVKEKNYDLIFMDHMMPEMDGIETTKIIRNMNDEIKSNIPIIALTANAVNGAMNMFIENGLNYFISKPIDDVALARSLLKLLPSDKIIPK